VAVPDKFSMSAIHFASGRDAADTRHAAWAACPDVPFHGHCGLNLESP